MAGYAKRLQREHCAHIFGRIEEQKSLTTSYLSDEAEFIVVYGRRRVGKTYLIREFFKQKKCTVFHATGLQNGTLKKQLKKFTDALSETFFDHVSLKTPKNWGEAFNVLHQQISKQKKKTVIFLDELPAEWFIDAWMSYSKQQYYVALLSAAALHSAAHQQPQEFQVMVDKRLRKITSGKLSIRFFYKKKITQTPIQKVKTNTGYIKISTPESTAFDLVQYIKSAGNLGNVATVLYELSEKIDPVTLVDIAVKNNLDFSCIQRLGFILDHIGKSKIVAVDIRKKSALCTIIIRQQK